MSESVMDSATPVAFGEIEAALARDVARVKDGAAPTRALTATVVAVGPRERLEEAVGPLQTLGTSGAIRGILIPQGPATVSSAQVASNVVVLNGLTDNFIDNAVAALRLSSLPTVIWWRGGPTDVLDNLVTLADRVVLDAEPPEAGWACALERLERAAFSDLRWTRLTRWRALMAQFFDMPDVRAAAGSLTRLRVEGSDRPAAALFAAWMKDAFQWGDAVAIDLVESPCRLAIGQVSLSGGGLDLNLHLAESRACVTSAAIVEGQAGTSRVVSLGDESLTTLLSEELRIRSRDHAFERALRAVVAS